MSPTKVAVVTGSNKGIGLDIVRGLCKQFDGDVYLTARNEALGKEAVAKLEAEGLHPKFHQLDIVDPATIERLRQFLADKYGGLDVLVNNAAIALLASTLPFGEQAEVSMKTNYFGPLTVYNVLKPLLRPHARVVQVSSGLSTMSLEKCRDDLRSQLKSSQTVDQISQFMNKFVSAAKAGKHEEEGWTDILYPTYSVTKVGVTLIAPIQQKELDGDVSRPDIILNACCPGYCATALNNFQGTKTSEQGADTPLYLALLPPNVDGPRGKFVSERAVKEY